MIELHVERTGHPSVVRRFSAATLTLGRASDCDLTLDDPSVSRRHCRLARAVDGWSVEDLESANGTRIDDDPVTAPRLIPPGAVLTVGAFRLTLVLPTPAVRPTLRPRTAPAWLRTARRLTAATLVVAATVGAGWTSASAWDVPLRLPDAPDGCPDDPAVAHIEAAITSPPVDPEDAVQSALDAFTRAPTLPAACDLAARTTAALTAALARVDHLRLGRHDVAVHALAAGADGRVAAIDRDGRLTLWSAHHRGEPLTPPALPEDPDTALLSLARSPDGRWLAAGADDGRVLAWDLHTSLPVALAHGRKPVTAVQFSDDRHLWTLDGDGLLHLWTLADGWTRTASTTAWPGGLTLTPARDGRMIAFGAGRAAVWTDLHRPPAALTTGSALRTLAVAPGGADIIAGDLAGKVTRWRLARTLRPEPITAHGGPIRAVAVQAGLVASVGDDDALRLVDLDRRVRRNGGPHLVLLAEVPVPVDRLVITGDRLIGSGSEGALVTWDLSQRTRRLPAVIHDGHRGPVTALLATPTAAISGGSDGAVRLWPAALEFPADTSLHDRACTVLGWDPAPCDD